MAHTFTNLLTHIVFSTKGRMPQINQELKPQLLAYMGGILRELQGSALLINGTADHMHLLVRLPPTIALADALRVLKTNSSRWIHERWPERADFAWQTGYGAFSVSQSNAAAILKYIANQEAHHRKAKFHSNKKRSPIYDGTEFPTMNGISGNNIFPPLRFIPMAHAMG